MKKYLLGETVFLGVFLYSAAERRGVPPAF